MPYHRAVRSHFRERQPELWRWFASQDTPETLRENVRFELTKHALRLERADRGELYRAADEVAVGVGLRGSVQGLKPPVTTPSPASLQRANGQPPEHTRLDRFSKFVRTFMLVPAQVVSTGRRLKLRLLAWNPWQHVFLRALDAVRLIS